MTKPQVALADQGSAVNRAEAARYPVGLQQVARLLFLFMLVVLFVSLEGRFLSQGNLLTILSLVAVLGIVSMGQTVVIVAGGFDLSVSGVVPLAGVTFAILINAGFAWPLAGVIAVAAGVIVGLVNGFAIAYLKLDALITTLATLSISAGLALAVAGGRQVQFETYEAAVVAAPGLAGIHNHVWIFVLACVVLHIVLRSTTFGRQLYAVGGSREAARLAGIRTNRVTLVVYVICGACAAVAGVILACQLLTGSGNVGYTINLESITAVVLGGALLSGGKGSVPGTLTGVAILGVLSNGLSLLHVASFYQSMATGAALLLAVLVSRSETRFLIRIPDLRSFRAANGPESDSATT